VTAIYRVLRQVPDTHTAGNRTSQTYPSGLALTYAYSDINALSSVTDGTNSIASFSYIGYRTKITTFGNGTTQTNTYGGFREELTTIHHETSAPATLVRMDYGYNKVHDRTYERFGISGSAGDAFEYDKARRLTKAWMGSSTPASPSGNTYVKTIAYNMDDDGNRTSVVTTPYGVSPTTESYTTNTLNQYTVVGGTSQTYDSNGNLTNNGTYKFKYNYKNLICEVRLSSNNNLVATYTYDAAGRRIGKAVSGGITQRFIYSDVETVETFDGSNAWKQDFVFDVTGIDRILMLEQADVLDQDGDSNTAELTRSYYHRSALGSVVEITTASQAEAVSFTYAPYGSNAILRGGVGQVSDPLSQCLGFTARRLDAESGLYYYRARSYGSPDGRFVQRDALGYTTGPSLYEYVRSSPTNRVDPYGLEDFSAAELAALTALGFTSIEIGVVMAANAAALKDSEEIKNPARGWNPRDAMRHCLWQCYMVMAWPPAFTVNAIGFVIQTAGHSRTGGPEIIGDLNELRGEGRGGTGPDRAMDDANNAEGRSCGLRSKSKKDCQDCCRKSLAAGNLIWPAWGIYRKRPFSDGDGPCGPGRSKNDAFPIPPGWIHL